MESDRRSPATTPIWVKVLGLAVLIVVLITVVMVVLNTGAHGPGLHRSP
jgi:hypothetical protein